MEKGPCVSHKTTLAPPCRKESACAEWCGLITMICKALTAASCKVGNSSWIDVGPPAFAAVHFLDTETNSKHCYY